MAEDDLSEQRDLQSEIEEAAVRLLAIREHTRAELIRKLRPKGDCEVIEEVLDHLIELNIQSDDRFVEQYVASRQRKGFGPVRIRQELKEKGVSSGLIGDWLDERDSVWDQTMTEVFSRKFGRQQPKDFKAQAKVARFLEYRGFASDRIRQFLRNSEFFIDEE